jgi:hypothetical protein
MRRDLSHISRLVRVDLDKEVASHAVNPLPGRRSLYPYRSLLTMNPLRIEDLSSRIATNVEAIKTHLQQNNLPEPSFDPSCPVTLLTGPEIQAARQAVIEATDELLALMLGPIGILTESGVCFGYILRRWPPAYGVNRTTSP